VLDAANDPTMPGQQAMVFLLVAQASETNEELLIKETGLADSSINYLQAPQEWKRILGTLAGVVPRRT
jgi:hypothetical protein